MSTNTTNKRKRITIDTNNKKRITIDTNNKINAVEKQEINLTLKMISHNQCCLPFIETPHSSLFPIAEIMTTLAITTL